ncbi:MAG TPA: TIGR02453 family protein [Porphyromonadaceae bacterium]|nr:TIGR02453 family protein [Porphyromonadaceae bacterium]
MKDLFKFLKELQANNNRDWFKANKPRYDALHKDFTGIVRQLIDKIATFDPEVAGLDAGSCIYRIYRDIRFSHDKTPYKTHFGAYMTGYGGRTSPYGGYYLHVEPGNSLVSGGVWCPTPAMLKQLRHDIHDNIDEFIAIIEHKKFKKVYGELEGEVLKRIPDGFPKDSPYEDILKHKNFVVSAAKPEEFFYSENWMDEVAEDFRVLYPFNKFLNYTIGEFFGKV